MYINALRNSDSCELPVSRNISDNIWTKLLKVSLISVALQLDPILIGAKKVSIKKSKVGNANQKPFERIMIMEYELTGIGKIKMTVGVRRRTLEKVQYCITAISSE